MLNVVVLHGRTSRAVEERSLPSGDRLAVIDLTVPAVATEPAEADAVNNAKARKGESVPLAWFDPPSWILAVEQDTELVAVGRVRRRFFRVGPRLESRTEVVVEAAALARRPARVAEVFHRAVHAVQLEAETSGKVRRPG